MQNDKVDVGVLRSAHQVEHLETLLRLALRAEEEKVVFDTTGHEDRLATHRVQRIIEVGWIDSIDKRVFCSSFKARG